MTKAEETAARVQADMERLKSVHRTTERNVLKEEKSQLEKENQALRYMVAQALPPPFDLGSITEWDRDKIMTKASQLSDGAPIEGTSRHEVVEVCAPRYGEERPEKEKSQLEKENHVLRDTVIALKAKVDASFGEGYFFTSLQVAQALPPLFDLGSIVGWDWDEIITKASQLSDATLIEVGPSQVDNVPASFLQPDRTRKEPSHRSWPTQKR
ncbi:hypothetical protein Q3G72_032677 [Acer saccharum]|nr:hypothetical protein Q3G72_032677 [Acer saccharum]